MSSSLHEPSSIAVLGLGYVGSVTAACMAQLGHRIFGIDKDRTKVDSILAGRAPFYEPRLEDVIRETAAAGRLTADTELASCIDAVDIVLICVGTPSAKNGNLSVEQLQRVLCEIGTLVQHRSRPLVVAVRSTVFPGTTSELTAELVASNPHVSVVSNPEFLREGAAVQDFLEPSLVVVGGDDPAAVQKVADLYAPLGVSACMVSLRTAEMIKYCCNAFHALKVAFANEVGALATQLDVSANEVMDTLCHDTRLNISTAYLKPGFAFGGSCLPKDLRALTFRASRLDLKLPLLEAVLPSNQEHLERGIREVLDSRAQRLGVFGLAFKENTDDLRESPVVSAIEQWIGKGREIRVFDPHIQFDQIYGSNRNFVVKALPHIGKLLAEDLDGILEWCDCVVVAQKPQAEMARRLAASGKPLVDLIGLRLGQPSTAA